MLPAGIYLDLKCLKPVLQAPLKDEARETAIEGFAWVLACQSFSIFNFSSTQLPCAGISASFSSISPNRDKDGSNRSRIFYSPGPSGIFHFITNTSRIGLTGPFDIRLYSNSNARCHWVGYLREWI